MCEGVTMVPLNSTHAASSGMGMDCAFCSVLAAYAARRNGELTGL